MAKLILKIQPEIKLKGKKKMFADKSGKILKNIFTKTEITQTK